MSWTLFFQLLMLIGFVLAGVGGIVGMYSEKKVDQTMIESGLVPERLRV